MPRDVNKLNSQFRRHVPPCSATATSVKGRLFGSPEKAVEGTRDGRLSPAARHVSSINADISTAPSGTGTNLKRESSAQFSATSCSGPLSRSERVQALSTQASVGRSWRDSELSLAVHRRSGVISRRRASPSSTPTRKKQHRLHSTDLPTDKLFTQLSHEILDQAAMTHASPAYSMLMHKFDGPAIGATHTHRVVEKPTSSPNEDSRGAHMYSTLIFGARLIVCPQLLNRVQSPQLSQVYPCQVLALRLTYPSSMRPNVLNQCPLTTKHFTRISPRPSLSTLHVLRLRIHRNLLMITQPCSPLLMTTANGQRFLNANHGPVGCQVIR